MRFFKDSSDSKWEISLPIGTVLRVKASSEGRFDLFEPWKDHGGKPLQEVLWENLGELYELLWYIVEPQAEAKRITAAQFGELVAADCLISARFAFFEEWRDFFHHLQRPNIAAALEKTVKYQAEMLKLVTAKLTDPKLAEVDAKVTAKMQSVLNKSFGDSLASLDSILVDSPGDISQR